MKETGSKLQIEFAESCGNGGHFIDEIMGISKSPKSLAEEDIHIRAMFVASDQVNSQGGRFDNEALEELCRMIPGAPVLVGHDKSKLPLARCFRAKLVERKGYNYPWVKVWFYWLKETSGSEDLLRNIDAGICSECSLGFSFALPQCSICGGDIRRCSHIPGNEYRGDDDLPSVCHYLYRNISRINEISLVYRGAVPNTAMTSDLAQIDESEQNGNDGAILYRLSDDSAALSVNLDPDSNAILMVFPQFSDRKLLDGKALVGKRVQRDEFGEFLTEERRVHIHTEYGDSGLKAISVEMNDCRILLGLRPAILNGERVYLLRRTA